MTFILKHLQEMQFISDQAQEEEFLQTKNTFNAVSGFHMCHSFTQTTLTFLLFHSVSFWLVSFSLT